MADFSIKKTHGYPYGSQGAAGFQAFGGGQVGTPGGQAGVGGAGTPATTPQDLVARLDALDANKIGPGSVGIQQPTATAAGELTPKVEVAGGTNGNFFTEGLGKSSTTPVVPAQTVAKGENSNLQKALANLGTGELTPVVDANKQWWA